MLVVSDNAGDLQQIVEQLAGDHRQVDGSFDPAAAAGDFGRLLPDVVVLAFDTIQKSDRYVLSLYRQSAAASSHRHRTVLLCAQPEVRAAYELCKKGCYDDYVLYWPMAQDGLRLSMSVWNAAQAAFAEAARPSVEQMASHAEQVQGVQTFVESQVRESQRFSATITGALHELEDAVGTAIDDFGRRAAAPTPDGVPAIRDAAAFRHELAQLKEAAIRPAFREGASAIAKAAAWPGRAEQRLASMASNARQLASGWRQALGATVMVVEDDEVQRELIAAALDGSGLELIMLPDGASLIGALRRRKPDMILMDINLPDINGVTLTRTITGLPGLFGVAVLMLTGDASRESLAESIEAGAVGYLVKPFTRQTLLRNVERFLPKPPNANLVRRTG